MIDLALPLALLLLPLPLALRLAFGTRAPGGAAMVLPEAVSARLPAIRVAGGWPLLPLAIWALVTLAVAGPRQLVPVAALPTSGRDLVIALDLSGSMVRDDFFLDGRPITRHEAVKRVGASFVRRRGGDRVALIVFGTEAYYAADFTFDTEAVAEAIETSVIGISGRATSISDALGLALKRLGESRAESRVVILLSDGISNAGATRPLAVARLATGMGVRVHTIAMGPKTVEDAPDENGVVDARTLQAIADLSGGRMFRVRTTEDLEAVAAELDRLEATPSDGEAALVHRQLWPWPAGLALLLTLAAIWREERT